MRLNWTRLPLHITIIALVILWTVPTLGLLVSSFRPGNLVSTTGWWTAFAPPYEFTFDNYERVLTRNGLLDARSASLARSTTRNGHSGRSSPGGTAFRSRPSMY